MIEPICTNIPKIYGFFLGGGRQGRRDKKKKKKSRNPQFFKSKICSMKMNALKEKWGSPPLDTANYFKDGLGALLGTGRARPLAGWAR